MNLKLKAKSYQCRFLEAGVAKNDDGSMVLIKNDSLMRLASKFKGSPVIIGHHDLDSFNIDKLRVGVITNVYLGSDNWAWCEILIDDEEALKLIEGGLKVSCAYLITEAGDAGTYHNIPYDFEVLDLTADHLALVENPRYEDVILIKNSKSKQMFKFLFKSKKEEMIKNAISEASQAFVKNEAGEKITMKELVENYKKVKNEEKEKEKESEELVLNADDEVEVEVDGSMVKVKDLMDCYNACKTKNEKSESEEEKKDEKVENEAEKSDEDKEEKKEEKVENSKEEESKEEPTKIQNSVEKFIEEVAEKEKQPDGKKHLSATDQEQLGKKIYGSRQNINS